MPITRRVGDNRRKEPLPRKLRTSEHITVSLERIRLDEPFYERVMPQSVRLVGLSVHLSGQIPLGEFRLIAYRDGEVVESRAAQVGRNVLPQVKMPEGSVLGLALVVEVEDAMPDYGPIAATIEYSYTNK